MANVGRKPVQVNKLYQIINHYLRGIVAVKTSQIDPIRDFLDRI